MEVRELRIGNLVSYDNRVFEIDTIAKEFPTLNTIDFGIGVVDWNNIKPIPITEEWLLKFGFKQDVLAERILFKSKPGRYKFCQIVDHYENGWLLSFDWWNQTGKMIKYIHQLQNIYFFIDEAELILNE